MALALASAFVLFSSASVRHAPLSPEESDGLEALVPNRRVQTAADAVLAGHTHLHRAAALQRTAQSLAAQLTANQQELEKELQADEAENERAAKLIAEEKEALRTHLGQLQQELEAQPKQAISTSLQRDIEQAVAMRDDLKKVHKNLKALESALVDIKHAQLASTTALERKLDVEEPRIQVVGPLEQDLERPSDEEWVRSTWQGARGEGQAS
eukprot:Transcript_21629.p3 GENE.Transcript_21629~~Transcript_21629.p3  ORF type:complete len:212 (-),score=90.11 Transcript_21629:133-768(-)